MVGFDFTFCVMYVFACRFHGVLNEPPAYFFYHRSIDILLLQEVIKLFTPQYKLYFLFINNRNSVFYYLSNNLVVSFLGVMTSVP